MFVSGQIQHKLWTRTDGDRTSKIICCFVLTPIRCQCW